jgi:hypothetical protein
MKGFVLLSWLKLQTDLRLSGLSLKSSFPKASISVKINHIDVFLPLHLVRDHNNHSTPLEYFSTIKLVSQKRKLLAVLTFIF